MIHTLSESELQVDYYSSGESDEGVHYENEEEKVQRIAELWCITIAKAIGAA